jgi:predicted ArsR family transcriptional regulator
LLKEELGKDGLATKLHTVGAGVATALQRRTAPAAPLPERLGELASAMGGLGYETESALQGRGRELVAHNCIFHQLAAAHPEICEFDLGFMEKFANAKVEHVECMARGQHVCRFRFQNKEQRG